MFNKRKQFLKREIKKSERIIFELPIRYDIIIEGKKMIREGIRIDYDKTKEIADGAETRLKTEQSSRNPDQAIIEQMGKLATDREVDMKKMEEQMNALDQEVIEAENTKNSKVEAARSYIMIVEKMIKNG